MTSEQPRPAFSLQVLGTPAMAWRNRIYPMFKLLSSLVLALALTFSPVYAETKTPPMKGGPVSGIFSNLLKKLQDVTLADLQYADALAQAHSNQISHTCYAAWINWIQAEQAATTGPDGKRPPLPTIHIFTDIEKALDLMHALQPTSAISIACAPLINDAKSLGISIGGVPLLP